MQAIRYFKAVGVRKFLYIDPEKLQTYYRVTFTYSVKTCDWSSVITDANGANIGFYGREETLPRIVDEVMTHLWVLTYSG